MMDWRLSTSGTTLGTAFRPFQVRFLGAGICRFVLMHLPGKITYKVRANIRNTQGHKEKVETDNMEEEEFKEYVKEEEEFQEDVKKEEEFED